MAKEKRKRPSAAVRALMNVPWPPELEADIAYSRLHDDTDGADQGRIIVGFTRDGDAWIETDRHKGPALRFRTDFGGGNSPLVRNALVLLALAIRLEEERDEKNKERKWK